jgi:fructose-1,6-bisphosphatase/inositol monophosphatase family enzyme
MDYHKELQVAKDIALKAGRIMLEYFDGEQGLEHKEEITGATEVTIADKKINSLVIKELSKHFSDGVIGEEESTDSYGMGRRWICDPIDGTKAFVIGVPTAMFSLGLAVDGKAILGVAYDPFQNKLFWGVKGQGSFCNGVKLRVSNEDVKGSYIEISSNAGKFIKRPQLFQNLIDAGGKLDMVYGAVYKCCLVAQGKVSGYLEAEVNPHDIAAVHVIVEEAGGKVTRYDGSKVEYLKPFRGAIISNGTSHDKILDCINNS